MFTIFTGILWIAAIRIHFVLNLLFLTLFLGFIGLDFKELAGSQALGTLAAWDLIICALTALYLMAHVVYADVGINLPVGAPKKE
jgi:succinate-acetate transporter protein